MIISTQQTPGFQPRPFLYTEAIMFIYVITVVALTASSMLHKYSNYIGVFMGLIFIAELMSKKSLHSIKLIDLKPIIPFAIFAGMLILHLAFFPAAYFRVRTYIQIVILITLVYSIVRITGRTWFLEFGFLCGLVLLWRSGAWQIAEGADTGQRVAIDVTGRGDGDEGLNPNVYALYLCTYLLFACRFAFVIFPRSIKKQYSWARLGVIIMGSLFCVQQVMMVTGSRKGQMLVFIIAGGVLFLFSKGKVDPKRLVLGAAIAIIVLLGSMYLLRGSAHFERLENLYQWVAGDKYSVRDGSLATREGMARTGISMWLQSPIFGHGNEGFRVKSGFGTYSHSNLVELLANFGILGFAAYYAFFVILFKKSLPYLRTRSDYFRTHGIWIILVLVCVLFWDLFAVSYYSKAIAVVLGAVCGIVHHYSSYRGFTIGKRGELPVPHMGPIPSKRK